MYEYASINARVLVYLEMQDRASTTSKMSQIDDSSNSFSLFHLQTFVTILLSPYFVGPYRMILSGITRREKK